MAHPLIESWFKTAIGKGLDPDGHYGWQCVDAVDHYAEHIFPGVSWRESLGAVPGARSLMDTANPKYFQKIWNDGSPNLIPKRGDVIVYEGWVGNEWGHTGVTANANRSNVKLGQQDGFAAPHQFVDGNWYSKKPAHYATYGYALGPNGTGLVRGWLRPKLAATTTVAPAASIKPTPAKDWFDMATKKELQDLLKGFEDRIVKRVLDRVDTTVLGYKRKGHNLNTYSRIVGAWQLARSAQAEVLEVKEIVNLIAKKQGLTTAEIAAAAERGAAKGAAEALADGIDLDITINGKDSK